MNSDWIELLSTFNARGVEFIIVGAHALAAHGHVRATKDLDIWVRPSMENAVRTRAALAEFGAPVADLTVEELAAPGLILQIGVPPFRVDILTSIDAVDFDAAWTAHLATELDGVKVAVLSRRDLMRNKSSAGRPQDKADVHWLERHPPAAGSA